MSFSVNKQILVGTLGRDAETRFTTNNVSVTNFSVATENSYKKDDEWVRTTTWHKVVAFNLSDYIKERLVKGAGVYVEGRTEHREYEDKDGIKRYSTSVISNQIIVTKEKGVLEGTTSSGNDVNDSDDDNEDLPF
jgi:single-strand DNA-binding protein